MRIDAVSGQPLGHDYVIDGVDVDQRDLVYPSTDHEVACRRRRL